MAFDAAASNFTLFQKQEFFQVRELCATQKKESKSLYEFKQWYFRLRCEQMKFLVYKLPFIPDCICLGLLF